MGSRTVSELIRRFRRRAVAGAARDVFAVERLEPRLLLSADPVLAPSVLGTDADEWELPTPIVERLTDPAATPISPVAGSGGHVTFDIAAGPLPETRIERLETGESDDAPPVLTVAGDAVLGGSGSLPTAVRNEGLLSPGYSPGGQQFDMLSQSADGELLIELGGTVPVTGHDRILVDNALTLDGALTVALINGFTLAIGDTFEILEFGTVSGSFSRVDGLVLDGGLFLEYQQTPGSDGTPGLITLTVTSAQASRTLGLSASDDTATLDDHELATDRVATLSLTVDADGQTAQTLFRRPTHSLVIDGDDGRDTVTLGMLTLGDTDLAVEAEAITVASGGGVRAGSAAVRLTAECFDSALTTTAGVSVSARNATVVGYRAEAGTTVTGRSRSSVGAAVAMNAVGSRVTGPASLPVDLLLDTGRSDVDPAMAAISRVHASDPTVAGELRSAAAQAQCQGFLNLGREVSRVTGGSCRNSDELFRLLFQEKSYGYRTSIPSIL